MRRIRNIVDEPVHVPLLGVTVQPGDTVEVPESLDYADFSEAYFVVDGDEPVRVADEPDVVEVHATDTASSDEEVL